MLALRLQRTGRKKVSNYRVIAQEHRFQPTSGKIVAYLGHYNPHTKEAELDTEQIKKYLESGARPSDAAAKLFKAQGIKLPDWVTIHEYEDKKAKAETEAADKEADSAESEKDDAPEKVADEADEKSDETDEDASTDAKDAKEDDKDEAESDADDSDDDKKE